MVRVALLNLYGGNDIFSITSAPKIRNRGSRIGRGYLPRNIVIGLIGPGRIINKNTTR